MEATIHLLEDPSALRDRDPGGMLSAAYVLVRETRGIVDRLPSLPPSHFHKLIFFGTSGGSRAAFDLVSAACFNIFPEPFPIHQGYGLPGSVDDQTSIFPVSYSGDTDKIFSNLEAAIPWARQLILISGGGALEMIACRENLYHVKISTQMEARSALGYLACSLLRLLEKLFSLSETFGPDVWESLVRERETLWEKSPPERKPAKQAALAIRERIPFLYGSDDFTFAVAERFRRRLAESRMTKRFTATAEILSEKEIPSLVLRPLNEKNRLTRLFSLMQRIDCVSIYYALIHGFDLWEVAIIRHLKERIKG